MRKNQLTETEVEVLDWLSEKRDNGRADISWNEFEQKVLDITDETSFEDVHEDTFSFNLKGVTIAIEDGKKMYPIRDLEQGITRGYSTD